MLAEQERNRQKDRKTERQKHLQLGEFEKTAQSINRDFELETRLDNAREGRDRELEDLEQRQGCKRLRRSQLVAQQDIDGEGADVNQYGRHDPTNSAPGLCEYLVLDRGEFRFAFVVEVVNH